MEWNNLPPGMGKPFYEDNAPQLSCCFGGFNCHRPSAGTIKRISLKHSIYPCSSYGQLINLGHVVVTYLHVMWYIHHPFNTGHVTYITQLIYFTWHTYPLLIINHLSPKSDQHGEEFLIVPHHHAVVEQFHLIQHDLFNGERGHVLPAPGN